MKASDLIPLLEAKYKKDQAKLARVNARVANIVSQRMELSSPLPSDPSLQNSIFTSRARAHHIYWRNLEVKKLLALELEIRPELNVAKAALKLSFGRLEALKSAINNSL